MRTGVGAKIVRWYCRGRHYRGKIHVARWLGRMLLPVEGGKYTLADGTRMLLHPRDWIEYRLLQRGDYEPLTLDFLRMNLKPGQTAVLAGVNIGLHVIVASRAVGPTGRVIGVEPQPASVLRARQNILLNDLPDNVLLVSGGLGSQRCILPMAPAPSHNSGMASFVDSTEERCRLQIDVRPLAELLGQLGMRRPDLTLLDVEGFELEVLRGIDRETAPKLMIVETKGKHLEKAGASEQALFDRLKELGYQSFHDLHGEAASVGSDLAEFNLVAVHERAEEVCFTRDCEEVPLS